MQYQNSTNLRAYFFGNMYLSPIQQGIQAAHVVTKMFVNHGHRPPNESSPDEREAHYMLMDWARMGVTKILLNGGYQSNLEVIHQCFEKIAPMLGLPFAKFHEEQEALNGALTCVGIVVPEEIYSLYDEVSAKTSLLYGANAETILASFKDAIAEARFGQRVAAVHLYHLLKSCRLA